MVIRSLSGVVVGPGGTPLDSGTLIVVPADPFPADADGLLAPTRQSYEIVDGALTGSIIGPAHYHVTVMVDGKVLIHWTANVSDADEPITVQDLYTSRHHTVAITRSATELIAAHVAAADPHPQYLQLGEAGSGDMVRSEYDPDGDGKVAYADSADTAPWDGITDKPDTYPAADHTHDDRYFTESETVALLNAKVSDTEKGAANGIATLGADGKVPSSQIPAVAITNTFVVADEAVMLTLDAEIGDVCVRVDESRCYILAGYNPGVLGDWELLLTPGAPVQSVNGQTGSVVLTAEDVGAAAAPTGAMIPFGGSVAPSGWLLCDGSAHDRTDQASLFGVIGTTYGPGNGTTTFNVPDARGRVIIGAAAATDHALGMTGGAATISHTHAVTSDSFQTQPEITGGVLAVTSVGSGGGSTDNRAPFVALNYIIKT